MTKHIITLLLFLFSSALFSQSIDELFSVQKMRKDFEVFKEIREKANSGLYKYRTKEEIDSMYAWAENEINTAVTYRDFYNIICRLTDFEGSLHNNTIFPKKYWKHMRAEPSGYFPYPLKWIEGKWRINVEEGELPLGAEVISINQVPIDKIMQKLYKYYTTDGENTSGKRIGLRTHFSRYYRWHYGLTQEFDVSYRRANSDKIETKTLKSVGYADYYKNFNRRYSKPYDQIYYANLGEDQKYAYKQLNSSTGLLTIHTFSMGNETTESHEKYRQFLDQSFKEIQQNQLKNLIVDIRQVEGGTDPNDLITYSYLTQRNFQENKEAWISFNKIPLLRHIDFWLPKFLRPLFVGIYNKDFQKEFPSEQEGKFYQDENSQDHLIRTPHPNAFRGNIYLLVSPAVASAGSLFAAMAAGNENTTTVGEETMGGYYGHNGHTPLAYKLPKSKMKIIFSVVNLEQDVPKKSNQQYNRGILPDIEVSQSFQDFMEHKDTQMEFTLSLINKEE